MNFKNNKSALSASSAVKPLWRWKEKDFGFRFRTGKGRSLAEHYQARRPGEFYVIPASQRKLDPKRIDQLALLMPEPPVSPKVVANPWQKYDEGWDWVTSREGDICFNYAGCLDQEEIHRREDEGVARAQELINELAEREEPVALTIDLVRQVHVGLMGEIYPFAGEWRTVHLTKGDGGTKWPLPPFGIQPLMEKLEEDVFSRTPFITDDNDALFAFLAELMGEFLALHPFREGNGRTAFILASLILMQNDLLPIDVYDRHRDQQRYYTVCESARTDKDYQPMAGLLAEWAEQAINKFLLTADDADDTDK